MPTSYNGSLLDHLAKHMVYLSTASSFWLSLDSSYDHEFHLSKQLGMSPQAFEYLLVAAQLAHFHKKWGFSIKKLKAEATVWSFAVRHFPYASLLLLLLMPHCWHWHCFCCCHHCRFHHRCCFCCHRNCAAAISSAATLS